MPGDRVALILPSGRAMACFLLAVMASYIVVPLSVSAPVQTLAEALSRSEVRCVVGGTKAITVAAAASLPVVSVGPGLQHEDLPRGSAPRIWMAMESTCLLLQTSGTTAVPKIVPFTFMRLWESGTALADSMALTTDDTGLGCMPLHHVGGIVCNLFATLAAGLLILTPPSLGLPVL